MPESTNPWDKNGIEQLRRAASTTMIQRIAWLEETGRIAEHLAQRAAQRRAESRFPGTAGGPPARGNAIA